MTISTMQETRENKMIHPSFRYVRPRVIKALRRFYLNDLYLLQEGAHERSMTFRLGMYLQEIFSGWDVDCEYNRNKFEEDRKKRIPWQLVYPDVIIHKRGTKNNLLAIEAKPPHASSDDISVDEKKIMEYVVYEKLQYQYGLFISFEDSISDTLKELRWFKSGFTGLEEM